LRRLFPHKRILILTHNRALIFDLRRRYRQLSEDDRQVELHTFFSVGAVATGRPAKCGGR
jgi:hypothetical protein